MSDQWPLPPSPISSTSGGPNPDAQAPSNTRWYALLGASLVVVFGLLAAATGIVEFGGEGSLETVEAAPAAPVFQPAFEEGPDPFFPIDLQLAGFQEETGEQPSDEAVASGLFGGTAQNTCDPQRLIDFLMQNPTEAQAWAQVQGIDVDEIPEYINSLAVRVLAAPAIVLNHGFDSVTGAPYEIETTLDAGTAVLVDDAGDIRTRCYCGNPVKPKPVGHRPPRCLVAPGMVYVVPGGEARRSNVPGDVVLTGQVTTEDDWVEISWGSDESQTGWTRASNLQSSLCRPASVVPTPESTTPSPTVSTLTPAPATPTPPAPAPTLPAATPPPATPTATPPPAPTLPAATPPPATPTATATATATPTPTPTTQQVEIRCFISDTDIMVLEQVEFSAFSVPADASIVYAFDHGDGFIDNRNPSFAVYNDPGSYDVSVIATIQGEEQRVFCGTVVVRGATAQGCTDQGYVGLTAQQAGSRAESMGCGWRITKIDGEAQIVTGDFREDRVNFELESGIVTRASIG